MHQDVITRIVICREGFFIFIFIFIFILSILAFSDRVPPSSTPTIKYPNGKLWVGVLLSSLFSSFRALILLFASRNGYILNALIQPASAPVRTLRIFAFTISFSATATAAAVSASISL